ncbi:DUF3893 domain-containing protein [Candidatus Parcubacteria bacterium]|jgi:hypothetical protein|nr:MAG: DUF3893 domain-containing protein [Candidatus Parcubacteria bacterium]
MHLKNQHQFILPTRFRLRHNMLGHFGVHLFTSSWRSEADNLAKQLAGSEKRAKTTLFNQAILSLSPVLVHGFRFTGYEGDTRLHQMLALEQYPGETLVKSLAKHWADVWLETSFSNLPSQQVAQQSQKLYDLIEDTGKGWVEKSALDALNDNKNGIRYSALPSLIAARFAANGSSVINGRNIKWGLIQQGDNGLAVVSDPQSSEQGGTFAYLIRFSLQYQPGNREPWIHASLTCQRYMDEAFESGNKDRNATILLRLSRPLHREWAHNQTLVRLPIWKVPRKVMKNSDLPRFPDGFHTLLDRAQAREILRDPLPILNTPHLFRQEGEDNYFVLYAEGYEPTHPLGSGFSAKERTEIFRDLEAKMESILTPGNAIPLFRGRIESRALAAWKNTETKAPKDPSEKQELRLGALRSATNYKPIRILLAWVHEDMGKSMYHFLVNRHLMVEKSKNIPDDFEIVSVQIPDALCRPLEIDETSDLSKAGKRLEAEQRMAGEWQKFLHHYKGTNEQRTFAWIELPSFVSDFTSPHTAIRMACIKEGIASQMINKLRSKYDYLIDMGRYNRVSTAIYDFGRLYNACGDLILRQMGVVKGDTKSSSLPDDYKMAGFVPDIAQNLVVIGLTVFKNNQDNYRGRGSVNFPIAVRLLPNGRVEAKIPSVCDWVDYYDATIELGRTFIKSQRRASFYIDPPVVFDFVREIIAQHREVPSLLMLDAYKLRNGWKSMKVEELQQDKLVLGGDILESVSMPNLNVVWVRQHADGETPQYVATNEYVWANANDADRIAHASLFEDTDANSNLRHFFSVGRLDNNNKADQSAMRHEEGNEMNFRNQQMLEIVPIMGNQSEAAAVVTHMLRSSPAWNIGNTALPYPIHLANTMVDDMLPLLGVEDNTETES